MVETTARRSNAARRATFHDSRRRRTAMGEVRKGGDSESRDGEGWREGEGREEDRRRTGDKVRGDSLGDIGATGWFVVTGRKTVPKQWGQKRRSEES